MSEVRAYIHFRTKNGRTMIPGWLDSQRHERAIVRLDEACTPPGHRHEVPANTSMLVPFTAVSPADYPEKRANDHSPGCPKCLSPVSLVITDPDLPVHWSCMANCGWASRISGFHSDKPTTETLMTE